MAIITVSRQMGTGAYQISRDLAKRLRYPLVDNSKVDELAVEYCLTRDELHWVDERPPADVRGDGQRYAAFHSAVDLLILESCRHGNVIIYGRAGQDLLAGMGTLLRLRFIAPFESRVETFAEREWLDPDLARALIRKSDQQRSNYVDYFFEREWNDPLGYDLVFNTSYLSPGTMIETVVAAARDPRLARAEAESLRLLEEKILCKRIETELLTSGALEHHLFRTTVTSGAVTLSGHVYSTGEQEAAVRIARSVAGTVPVIDNLQVVEYRRRQDRQ